MSIKICYRLVVDEFDQYNTDGLVVVAQLEKETYLSSRSLHRKFSKHLGIGPKNRIEIVRFKKFYHSYSNGVKLQDLMKQIHNHHYDKSHFIRAFKSFTGSTPTYLQNSLDNFQPNITSVKSKSQTQYHSVYVYN